MVSELPKPYSLENWDCIAPVFLSKRNNWALFGELGL
jgi:hypothetical protein